MKRNNLLLTLLCAITLFLTACPSPPSVTTDSQWDTAKWDTATWK